MLRGKFIAIDGGEGSGKTTLIRQLQPEYPEVLMTHEPGGTPAGQRIRSILVDDATLDLNVQTELYLFMADRAEHMAKVVVPALSAGTSVLTDRSWISTLAYQWDATMGRRDVGNFLGYFKEWQWPLPDLWIWLDSDPEIGLARKKKTDEFNRIDQRKMEFHQKVRAGFKFFFEDGAQILRLNIPMVRIDANQSQDAVYEEVDKILQPILNPQHLPWR